MLEALSLAAGLSWASGLRLYLTIFVAGVFERIGLVHLPDTLSVLGSPWVIGVAALLTIVEFFADKIPAFDSLWDAIHTLYPHSGRRRAGGRRVRPRRSDAVDGRRARGRHARRRCASG